MPVRRVVLSNRRMAFGDEIIDHGAERAEQKGQPITTFARQQRKEFRSFRAAIVAQELLTPRGR
jgi:hypothetical protein